VSVDGRCRVLVVDDSPSDLHHIERLLRDGGFDVVTAAGRASALALLRTEYVHVAVIDVCLAFGSAENRDGVALMADMRWLAPTVPVILLHDNPSVDLVREVLRPTPPARSVFALPPRGAYDFLLKTDTDLLQLPQSVWQAFDALVHANLELEIIDQEGVLRDLAHKLRFVDLEPPGPEGLAVEMRALMQKLFADWDMVRIQPIATDRRGYSRALVFVALPQQPGGRGGEVCVVKVAEHTLIEKEVSRHRSRVHMTVARSARALEPVVRTRALGGVVYTFVGLGGGVRDFAQVYRSGGDAAIASAIRSLFQSTLLPLHGLTGFVRTDPNPRRFLTALLRLDDDELHAALDALVAGHSALTRSSADPRSLRLGLRARLPDPVAFALGDALPTDYRVATIHGDLHVHNVLLDERGDTWLIDFANADEGPLIQDYATFEVSLLVEMADESAGWEPFYEWALLLTASPGQPLPPLPARLAALLPLARAHAAVGVVRELARRHMEPDARAYLICLLYTALRMTTVKFLTPEKSLYALILAAAAARALGAAGSE